MIMMAASSHPSRRALSLMMRYDNAATSARPTTKAARSTRLNFALRPISHPLAVGFPDPGPVVVADGTSVRVDQPCGLVRCQSSRHLATDFVLETPDRGPRLRTEQAIN